MNEDSTPDAARDDQDPIARNTETMQAIHSRQAGAVGRLQKAVELLSEMIGSPLFLVFTICWVGAWIAVNLNAVRLHTHSFDSLPFSELQGLIGFSAMIVTLVVLIKQNRLEKLEERRVHLELQLIMLTEQKVTKLISLIEELRTDLPMVADRQDAVADALRRPTDPETVLQTLDELREEISN